MKEALRNIPELYGPLSRWIGQVSYTISRPYEKIVKFSKLAKTLSFKKSTIGDSWKEKKQMVEMQFGNAKKWMRNDHPERANALFRRYVPILENPSESSVKF